MASCYGGGDLSEDCVGLDGQDKLTHILPIRWQKEALKFLEKNTVLLESCELEIDFFSSQEEREEARILMNLEIESGLSWPFEEVFPDFSSFSKYFLSHSAFVVRVRNFEEKSVEFQRTVPHGVLGCFYVKPNFPGRCGHVCNGGFIVRKEMRGNGIGQMMGRSFLPLARDLGYSASFFNLVFVSNTVSDRMWEKLGYKVLGIIPKVARLKGVEGLVDAKQYYFDLTTVTEYKKHKTTPCL